jgi:hypothetical protein
VEFIEDVSTSLTYMTCDEGQLHESSTLLHAG